MAQAESAGPAPKGLLAALEASIVFEDARLLAINKPSGVASHGGSGVHFGVIETLRALRPNQNLELVHRLDRETSGLLVVAKKRSTLTELQALLREVVRGGGEGLMLHRGASLYRAGRGEDLLKLKTHDDAEARVIAHVPGKGKHAGRLGALMVETPEGRRFALGTGFTDAQRADPPPVGSWVTYRFRGLHEGSGLPRFASFLRVRSDEARFRSAPR